MGDIYRFFEWAGAQDGYGAYGFERWEKLHTGPGSYNWAPVDAWLEKQSGKKTAFAIATHLSQLDGWESFADCTPSWVYDGMNRPEMHGRPVGKVVSATIDGRTVQAALPYYNDQTRWWRYLQEFVAAFGARYDGRFDAVFAGPGLDIENQPSKSPFGDGNQSNRFGQLCMAYSDWHKQAFTRTPVYVVVSIGQGRMALAQHAAVNGQGVKHNGGFIHDLDSHQGYGEYIGSWDAMEWAAESNTPTWVESAYGFMDKKKYWWAIYASLHYHPVAVDIHSGLLDTLTPEQVQFIRAHTGVTAETAPSAWCVLRDMEYPVVRWTGSNDGKAYGCSGHPGDWEFYMRMLAGADAPRVEDVGPSDAPESRQSRRITSATFEVDAGFAEPPYTLTVRWLCEPDKTLTITHEQGKQVLAGVSPVAWETVTVPIASRAFTLTGNGAAVHMLQVTPITEPPPDPEPPEPDWSGMLAKLDEADNAVRTAWGHVAEAHSILDGALDELHAAEVRHAELLAMIEEAE